MTEMAKKIALRSYPTSKHCGRMKLRLLLKCAKSGSDFAPSPAPSSNKFFGYSEKFFSSWLKKFTWSSQNFERTVILVCWRQPA